MAKFEFKAFTQEGKLKEGILSAENKDAALKILQDQGLLVTYLSEKKPLPIFFYQKASVKDIFIFTKQLSYLVKAQTPLDEAIKSLAETSSSSYLRSVLLDIYNDLVSGIGLSQAFSRFPDIFDEYYVGLIKVGETVGRLDETLNYLADHLQAKIKFKNRIIQTLIYPVIVISLFIGVMIALFYFVIPQITQLFVENNISMPLITKIFQAVSQFLLKFGLFLLIIFGFLIYYFMEYFKAKEGRVALFKFGSNLPVIGPLLKNIYAGRFLESLYYLTKGGVPIVESLEIVKKSIAHPLYESAIEYIIENVKKGEPLSESLKEFPELFPSIIVEGIKTSEKTGQLSEITFTILGFYNETIESQIASLGEALQPILILILGAGLGLLQASLLIPLLQLTKYVQTF